jgi:hypothetical protein
MPNLTALEEAVLVEICRQQGADRPILERQLATATVTSRKNSGAGFFTYLAVDRTIAPVLNKARTVGDVVAIIDGFEQPLLLMLFMKDGYAEMLEGAAVVDSTVGIDFSSVRFRFGPA